MKKNKIFIALNDYQIPNPLASYGIHLAKRLERPAHLCGVQKVPVITQPNTITGAGIPPANLASIGAVKKEAAADIKKLQEVSMQLYSNITSDIEIGFPEATIIEKTENENPYLVLVEGNNELTTLHEWFGTYETRLAENIDSPVLVVPTDYFWKPVKKIVYIMELDDQKVSNMRFLTDVAAELEAEIAVVLISEKRNEQEMAKYNSVVLTMRNLLGYENVNFHQIFSQDSAETIDLLINKVGADWLAFEHESRSFLERMIENYNTKRLILQSEIPVLVF